MPQMLVKLVKEHPEDELRYKHLHTAIDSLLNYTPLLDMVDTKCKLVIITCFLHFIEILTV